MGLKAIVGSAVALTAPPNAEILDYRDRSAVAGSAAIIGDPLTGAAGKMPRRQAWQQEAFGFTKTVGEAWHAQDYVGNCFAKIRLRPGYIQDDDSTGPIFDDDGQQLIDDAELAAELIRQLKGPLGGQRQFLKSAGELLTIAGELFIVATDRLGPNGEIVERYWEVLSTSELQPSGDGKTYKRVRPGLATETLPAGTLVLRCWRPDPEFSNQATSGFRAQLEILEEVMLLTRSVRANVISRLTQAGLLFVPSEITFASDPNAPPGSEDEDPFTVDLIETAAAAISDRGSAASAVPMVVRAPAMFIHDVVHMTFQAPDDAISVMKRTEAIQRFAQGIDLPVESILGHLGTTFANAAAVSEQEFTAYLEPKLQIFLDALTAGYLRPMLMVARGLEPWMRVPDDIARMVIWYDESALVLPKDMSAIGIEAYDRLAVGPEGLRHYLGISESFAPDDETLARMVRLHQELNVKETIKAEEPPDEITSLVDPALLDPAAQPGNPSGEPGVVGSGNLLQQILSSPLSLKLAVGMEVFVQQALERSGAKLRAKANGRPEFVSLRDVPNHMVPQVLGPRACQELLGDDVVAANSFDFMRRMVLLWGVQAGVADPDTLADAMMTAAEQTARQRLFDPAALVDLAEILELTTGGTVEVPEYGRRAPRVTPGRTDEDRAQQAELVAAVAAIAEREPTINVTMPPAPHQGRSRRVERDAKGNITRIVEED